MRPGGLMLLSSQVSVKSIKSRLWVVIRSLINNDLLVKDRIFKTLL